MEPHAAFQYGSHESAPFHNHPRYELREKLGQGGMGVVYHAFDRELLRDCVLKWTLASAVDRNALLRFEREAQIIAQLKHHNLVQLFEYGRHKTQSYISFEYIRGTDLKSYVLDSLSDQSAKDKLPRIVQIFTALAEALEYCHSCSVLHRDIKPENILIEDSTERPVLIDFGVSKVQRAQNTPEALTKTGDLMGTPWFMSPEQLGGQGHEALGPATDVWGLGATLYYALTAQRPFEGDNVYAVYRAVLQDQPPAPQTLNPQVPSALSQLCMDCLSKDPTERPSLAQLRERLADSGSSSGSSPWTKILAASLGLSVLILLIWLWPRETKLLRLENPKFFKSKSTTVRGQVNRSGIELQCAGLTQRSDKQGRFEMTVSLSKTRQTLTLKTKDGLILKQWTVQVDEAAPKLHFDQEFAEGLVLREDSLIISGRVQDASPCQFVIDGQAVKLSPSSGSFLWEGRPRAQTVTLECRDAVGHRTVRTLRVLDRGQVKACWALMGSREAWSKATEQDQDLCLTLVAKSLGPEFQPLGPKRYACGGRSYRIGRFKHKGSGIVLHLIPGGSYLMGTTVKEAQIWWIQGQDEFPDRTSSVARGQAALPVKLKREMPAHVAVIKPFLLACFETSMEQWQALTGESIERLPRGQESKKLPVTHLTWIQVMSALSKSKTPLRLPSESEWEYACRAPGLNGKERGLYYWGSAYNNDHVWYRDSSGTQLQPHDAHDQFRNAFGLADMIGNVWELCRDELNKDLHYRDGPHDSKPIIHKGALWRVRRGGSYLSRRGLCRGARRSRFKADFVSKNGGQRLALSLPELKLSRP